MPNEEHVQAIIDSAGRLIDASSTGRAGGATIAREAGLEPNGADAYHAFREAERRGAIAFSGWKGGLRGPYDVERPTVDSERLRSGDRDRDPAPDARVSARRAGPEGPPPRVVVAVAAAALLAALAIAAIILLVL